MDELFQLVIFIAILALGLLSSRKKKQPRTRGTPSAGRRAPAASTATARGRPREAPPTVRRTRLEETLLELLGQQALQPEPHPEVEASSMETVSEPEARSLEALEISSEARHAEFHDRYMEPVAPPRAAPALGKRLTMSPKSIREAVIWKAVLGPPKGLDP